MNFMLDGISDDQYRVLFAGNVNLSTRPTSVSPVFLLIVCVSFSPFLSYYLGSKVESVLMLCLVSFRGPCESEDNS